MQRLYLHRIGRHNKDTTEGNKNNTRNIKK